MLFDIMLIASKKQPRLSIDLIHQITTQMDCKSEYIEFVYHIVNRIEIDQIVLDSFVMRWMNLCKVNGTNKDINVMYICKFITKLAELGYFCVKNQKEEWAKYCEKFKGIEQVEEFRQLLDK